MAIGIIVEENIKEGQVAAYVAHMGEMLALTKQEDGCIAYDIYEDIDIAGKVVMMEIWESMAALEKHMASEHFQKYVPSSDVYKNEPSVIRRFSRL